MGRSPIQPAVTSDLREEFDAETQTLLRRRFIRFAGVMSVIAGSLMLMSIVAATVSLLNFQSSALNSIADLLTPDKHQFLTWVFGVAVAGAYLACYIAAKRGSFRRDGMLQLTYLMVVADTMLHVGGAWAGAAASLGLFGVMVTHVTASFFLPWTPVQSLKPVVPALVAFAVKFAIFGEASPLSKVVGVLATALIAGPGLIICWVRYSQRFESFKLRFFQRRYGDMRRELFDARKIHEALFPAPIIDGRIQFKYLYEPMHQIGGDYLYAAESDDDGRLNIVVMDVTGHGIPAALTVNRLHGELQRVFAEEPDIAPGRVLSLLNRYVYLTLSNHSVFVTALCLRFDADADTVEFASGGHPTAYLRAVDGTVHELASTAILLGAMPDSEFHPQQQKLLFCPGDSLIAYTDGAIEARDVTGRMIGLSGMQRLVAGMKPSLGAWPSSLIKAVDQHRNGPPHDDTLVIEVFRPVGEKPAQAEVVVTTSLPQPV